MSPLAMVGVVALAIISACVSPLSTTCPGGGVCPPGLVCLAIESGEICVPATCGDGELDPGESCDDGNHADGDGCARDCGFACGNGVIDDNETCDDGNATAGDGCSPACAIEACGNGVVDPGEPCDDGNRRNHDGCSSTCAIEQPVWSEVHAMLAENDVAAAAYDTRRARIITLGGCPGLVCKSTTWELDHNSWVDRTPSTAPAARRDPAMAYDAARGQVVMFGGCVEQSSMCSVVDETWVWDGGRWQVKSTAFGPSARSQHAMTYDSARGRVVMFGGEVDHTTWEWDGAMWHQIVTTNTPEFRWSHAMAYDPARARVVLFGGRLAGGAWSNETWEYDGIDWKRFDGGQRPSPRSDHAMAFMPARGKTLLLGGCAANLMTPTCTAVGDAWEWNGAEWKPVAYPGGPIVDHALVYDIGRGRIATLGGVTGSPRESWEWDGTTWSMRSERSQSEPLSHLALDPLRGRVVAYGDRTWEWDGTWRVIDPFGDLPTPRVSAGVAYDLVLDRVVMFGGADTQSPELRDDVWTWDGARWASLPTTSRPEPRRSHALVHDNVRRSTVLFGGQRATQLFDDTWEWNGAWSERSTMQAPLHRVGHRAIYDSSNRRVMLYGGRNIVGTPLGDLWGWDGHTWTEEFDVPNPGPRVDHGLVFDRRRGSIILFGGVQLDDTWEYRDGAWQLLEIENHPGIGPGPSAMVHDPARGASMMVDPQRGTWLFRYEVAGGFEACHTQLDGDGDGLVGCADPDCEAICDPACAALDVCDDPARARCGDGTCSAIESCRSCAADCGACNVCGDHVCDGAESGTSCPGDCAP